MQLFQTPSGGFRRKERAKAGKKFAATGNVSLPLGMSFSRASVATCKTSDSTTIDLKANSPGVAHNRHGYVGLQHEASSTNIVPQSSSIGTSPWSQSAGAITKNAVTAPDGTITASRDKLTAATQIGCFQTITGVLSSTTYSTQIWAKPTAGAPSAFQFAINVAPGAGIAPIACGYFNTDDDWRQFSISFNTNTATGQRFFPEHLTTNWSSLTTGPDMGVNSSFQDNDLWGIQIENKPFPTSLIQTGSTSIKRQPTYFSFTSAASVLDDGCFSLQLRVIPRGKNSDYSSGFYLWYMDGSNYAKVNGSTRILTVVVGGSTIYTSNIALDWWQDRPVDIWLSVGNGSTKFAYQKWDSGWVLAADGDETSSLNFGSNALYILSGNTDNTHFDCLINSIYARRANYDPTLLRTTQKTTGVIVCDGNSLTAGTGAQSTLGYWVEQLKRRIGEGWTIDYSMAVSGQPTSPNMIDRYPTHVRNLYGSNRRKNILVFWEETNELNSYLQANSINNADDSRIDTAVDVIHGHAVDYIKTAKADGWTVIWLGVIARGQLSAGSGVPNSFEPARVKLNALDKATWKSIGADDYIDLGNHPLIGNVSNTSDTLIFRDYVHLVNLTYYIVMHYVYQSIKKFL